MVDPPPLPPRLSQVRTVAAAGTALWLLGAVALWGAWLFVGRPLDVWFSTCVAGVVIGGIGYGIFSWQRAAVRQGSRTAQQGVE